MKRYSNCCPCCGSTCPCPRCCFGPMGPQGLEGPQGPQGIAGTDGLSAFESAQQGGYTGTETEFYAALANISEAILSATIRSNEVVTMAQYQALASSGGLDSNTAYDIIEEVP